MKKLLLAGLVLFTFALSACGGEAAGTPDAIPAEYAGKTNPLGAESAAVGAEIYKTYCAA